MLFILLQCFPQDLHFPYGVSVEILYCRLLQKWWNNFKVKEEDKKSRLIINQWTEDYKLVDWGPRGLYPEYLEMGEFSISFLFYVDVFICSFNDKFVWF